MIKLHKDTTGKLRQQLTINAHALYADVDQATGGDDSAPDPHDLFDSSLAACTAITLTMYAKRRGMALESINLELVRDNSQEKAGHYGLAMQIEFVGALTDSEREQLANIVSKCPIHKLMSHGEIDINTQVLGMPPSEN